MAKVIFVPDQHRCLDEIEEVGPMPIGTIVECSCGTLYIRREHQLDGPYWSRKSQR